jgi:hypothetical protein
VYLDRQGASALHPLPSPSRSLDKTSLRMARPSMHLALPQAACCHTEIELDFSAVELANFTQVAFAFIRHTLETQISCMHAGPNFAIGKELFNESQLHIILHPFYTQHCVGKTWKGWGPSLLVDGAPIVDLAPTGCASCSTANLTI